jgi:S1-C subfamily serine protease
MKRTMCAILAIFVWGCSATLTIDGDSRLKVVSHIVKSVPMISCGEKTGSGILFKHNDQVMMLTAAHILTVNNTETVGPLLCDSPESNPAIHVVGWNREIDKISWVREATVVEIDEKIDFAVLRLSSTHPDMDFAVFSKKPAIMGERIFMVGSPMMDASSLSSGIVSHPNRDPSVGNPSGLRYIQTDAAGYFGSSGGGLFRENDGTCIGMVVMRNPQYGMMYALPIESIQALCPKYF